MFYSKVAMAYCFFESYYMKQVKFLINDILNQVNTLDAVNSFNRSNEVMRFVVLIIKTKNYGKQKAH